MEYIRHVADRHELRRKFRRLESAGDVRFVTCTDHATLQHDISDFLTLHRESRDDKAAFMNDHMEAFFRATFDAWKDCRRSGREKVWVGYSPIIGVDGEKIIQDLPHGHVLHVVRNPWSAYADTKKRPVPMSLESYMLCWNVNQYYALLGRKKYPGRYHVVRTEDVMADSTKAMRNRAHSA